MSQESINLLKELLGEKNVLTEKEDLGDRDATIGAAEPLHVAHPGIHPQRSERARGDALDAVVPRIVDLARQHDAPLDPRLANDLER